jgi:superfamily II DNA helicase RecQ
VILDLVKLTPVGEGDEALLIEQRENPPERKAAAGASAPAKRVNPRVERQLYMKMQELRQKVAVAERGKSYLIAGNGLLKEIAKTAPRTEDELMGIIGFRSSGLAEKGAEIVQAVEDVYQRLEQQ